MKNARSKGRGIGALLRGKVARQEEVTISIRAATVEDALRRILGDQSFAVWYGRDGEPGRIDLLGESAASASGKPSKPSRESTLLPKEEAATRPGSVATDREEDLGASATDTGEMLAVLAAEPDISARSEAIEALAGEVAADPAVAADVLTMFGRIDDQVIAAGLEEIAGPAAARMATEISARTEVVELKKRMAAVASQLAR